MITQLEVEHVFDHGCRKFSATYTEGDKKIKYDGEHKDGAEHTYMSYLELLNYIETKHEVQLICERRDNSVGDGLFTVRNHTAYFRKR